MSAPAIEARSLSTLTSLASNPPSYPRNPTHVRNEPLVLYIARVPGSRDVFLSPMKPREKVVTAEDIQNSLYFIHVEQPEDAHLIEPPTSQSPSYPDSRPNSSHGVQQPIVQRKPVTNPALANVTPAARRKPIPGTLAPINGFENTQNSAAGNYTASTGLLGPDYVPRRSFESAQYDDENRPPLPRRPSQQPASSGTSLTLIRRDLASGAQWNVARIEDPPILDVSSSTLNDTTARRKAGAPVYIEITNPGYSKFLHAQPPPLLGRDTNAINATYGSQTRASPTNRIEADGVDGVFRRRLWMEGAKHSGGEFGHRRLKSSDSNMPRGSPRSSVEAAQRDRLSMDSRPPATPPFLTRENQSYGSIQVSEKQSVFRGYVFTSPWNGRCEFITGAGGGSLKCRHIVPGLQGASPVALPVSELRFNLPSSPKASTPRGEDSSKRSSFFHRPRHSRNNSLVSGAQAESTEDVRRSFNRLDLSLGQEFAGGGFGGKRAKLGKLIIEDEGLKMVDLLVAANLALWWRAYER
ncbi:hypothetical protein BU23DRAFT_549133 [Bimuria novae-zelandiae CBS 107.79]|uniref:Oxidoreductase-like protein n=1 Tax=Bimuria novae-zelandiae CBS 107.79 TaxID=1447943 RepID=A0A6A5VSS5_9PLEO|nr:hypothetical protein BU23DRAFT_549133 [Bimuria novae-zelandiae CBS 107.79]